MFVAALTIPYAVSFGWLWYAVKIPAYGIAARAAFFDIIMNKIRSKPFFYNSSMPFTKAKSSLLDMLENKLSVPYVIALKITYIIIFIIVFIFVK